MRNPYVPIRPGVEQLVQSAQNPATGLEVLCHDCATCWHRMRGSQGMDVVCFMSISRRALAPTECAWFTQLSVFDMVKLGVVGVPMVATSIGAGLLVVRSLGNRVGLPPRLGSLIAAGTSICGVTAVVSLAPVIKATDQEVPPSTICLCAQLEPTVFLHVRLRTQ